MVAPSLSSNPSLYRKLSYDPIRDFAPISQLAAMAYILDVHPSVPAKTVKEFVALAKSKKGGLIYASPGNGQLSHLGMELLKSMGGFDAVHVPYKGDAPAMADLIAGQVDAFILSMVVGRPQVRSGRIGALAVTSLSRSLFLPDVPSVAESGFPGYEVNGWFGFLAPAGMPREFVTRLHNEVSRILKLADVRELMAANGLTPVGSTPEEFAAHLRSQIIKWAKVIKQSGARAD